MQSTKNKISLLLRCSQRLQRLFFRFFIRLRWSCVSRPSDNMVITLPVSRVRTSQALCAIHQRWSSADAAMATPPAEGQEKQYPPKLQKIVDEISQLTLLEVADLNELLKKTLNIADTPMMPMAAMPMMAAGAAAQAGEEPEEKTTEKMSYKVRLTKFDESKKVALIKQIKALIEGMNLVQAKKFVESAPTDVKSDLTKAEAEELQKKLEEAGGSTELI